MKGCARRQSPSPSSLRPSSVTWRADLEKALPAARKAMTELANAFDPDELAQRGFSLYEQFRPQRWIRKR